jgi:uncharacterized protein YkwD
MFSFQILDGGEVLTFALDSRPVVIGSSADCDIRLRSSGVASHHARVEPLRRDGALTYKLVDLGSPGGTRVNGDAVAQVALAVGDRIEIAGATLVLGKRVVRRATPADVLDEGVRTRLRRPRETKAKNPWLPYALAGGIVLLLGGVWLLGSDRPPASLVRVPELLAKGDHEEAERLVQHARATWALTDAPRLAVLEGYASEVARLRRHIATLEKDVVATAGTQSVGEQIDALRGREAAARDAVERAAARRVIARVHDLRQGVARAPHVERDAVAEASARPQQPAPEHATNQVAAAPAGEAGSPPTPPQPAPAGTRTAPPPAREDLASRVTQAMVNSDLRLAGVLLDQMAAGETELAEQAGPLRTQWAAAVATIGEGAITQADELLALGRGAEAAEFLRALGAKMPDAQRAQLEQHAQTCMTALPAAAAATPERPFADPLGELLRLVEAGESALNAGDFAAAQQQFVDAAQQVGSRDANFAAELRARAEDCRLLAGLHGAVAKGLRSAAKPELRLSDDKKVRLVDCDAGRLRLVGDAGELTMTWTELPAAAVDSILKAVDPAAEAFLGAAVLALGHGDEPLAEQRLLAAMRKDAGAKAAADQLLARARGESVPESGYKLEGGRFVAASLSPLVKELDAKFSAALKGDVKGREAVLSEVLDRGPEQLDAVLAVLRRHQRALADRLQNHSFKKNWERVAAERKKLDAAREQALALIFDEANYFYPYTPPAVSSAMASQYLGVQREVNKRVDAVRAIWDGSSAKFQVPEAIADDLDRFRWVARALDGFGERSPAINARMRWVLSLPDVRTLDVKTFCRDADEVEQARLAARIAALNAKRGASLSAAEREQLKVTNEYRAMMGRRPLVVDMRILAAARKHCDEMERLSYFGHVSPVAENKTPYDRMRVAGYAHGGSENIATNDSAVGAHQAWLNSSGHHRNILGIAHTEFACGQRGRLWTQNFGAGRDFETELPP